MPSAKKEAMLPPTASSDEEPLPPVESPTLSSIDDENVKKRSADASTTNSQQARGQ
jgi:hypothetical protein